MLYCFTNRRRAKDTIMLIAGKYGTDNMTVFVNDELVYVDVPDLSDLDTIMHYAEFCPDGIESLLTLDSVEELYQARGILRFRV